MDKVTAIISPTGTLDLLSQKEVARLRDVSEQGLHDTLRRCALAVLKAGDESDDVMEVMQRYADFDIQIHQQDRGIRLEVINAPAKAFVDGKMIRGVREHLFAVLRDIVFISSDAQGIRSLKKASVEMADPTDFVFHILRHARLLNHDARSELVVCWGGHSISRNEYVYCKKVGYELGLRQLNIVTGCGAGAMKGPMKGAAVGHLKQRVQKRRYIGITEPGIIASESPNAMVNELVILPDIEKRLEAFVRLSHAIIVFPGGVGTAEEILYLLGILLHPDNQDMPFPLIFTGPASAEAYFEQLDQFIKDTLGSSAQQRYQIIIDDPQQVARVVNEGIQSVYAFRREASDAFYFNWRLQIDEAFQTPFAPTHENMCNLTISRELPAHELASQLRRAFSGLVAGNIKEEGIREVEQHGPYQIQGDAAIMQKLDQLLQSFIEQKRMKLPGKGYKPCYEIVTS